MVCIYCKSRTSVSNSRLNKKTNTVWRRRKCISCSSLLTTKESVLLDNYWQVKSKGKITKFNRDKLLISLHKSLSHRSNSITHASNLSNAIIAKIFNLNNISTIDIDSLKQIIIVTLKRYDKVAYMHYSASHSS